MNIFFTSDHHWYHENILKFTKRGFSTLEEMHIEYIKRWNKKVKPKDLVYILGDNVWSTVGIDKYRELMNKLNGIKILIEGNHCKVKTLSAYKLGLTTILQRAVIKLGKTNVMLSHYPYKYGFWKSLYTNIKNFITKGYWPSTKRYKIYPENRNMWLLHGHTHSDIKVKDRQIHIGVDAWNGYPVSAQEILDIINKRDYTISI